MTNGSVLYHLSFAKSASASRGKGSVLFRQTPARLRSRRAVGAGPQSVGVDWLHGGVAVEDGTAARSKARGRPACVRGVRLASEVTDYAARRT
jgi:hypothetical protein